jgi:hypothetical protein
MFVPSMDLKQRESGEVGLGHSISDGTAARFAQVMVEFQARLLGS